MLPPFPSTLNSVAISDGAENTPILYAGYFEKRKSSGATHDAPGLPHGRFWSDLCLDSTAANSWASVLRE